MKNLLIALDYEDSSLEVAKMGHRMARALSASPVLLHVVQEATYFSSLKYSPIMGYDNFSGLDTIETDNTFTAKKIAEQYLAQIRTGVKDDSIQTMVEIGDYSEIILSTALKLKVEMIIMGTHHRSGIGKILAGSIAEKVLHQSTIPILIIPVKND